MSVPGNTDSVFQELALPQVDGALAELSESDRDAVILRFLHQQSFRDVAQTLGTSEEAAKKRPDPLLRETAAILADAITMLSGNAKLAAQVLPTSSTARIWSQ